MAVPVVEPEVLKSPETKMQEETVTKDQGFLPALLPEAVNSLGLVLKIAYHRICVNGESPVYVLNSLAEEDRNNATAWLQTHYNAGAKSKTLSIDVLNGLRAGVFDKNGDGAFAMVAYLHGATAWLDFNMVDILRGAKEQ
jgi:hypothetical protein